MMEQYMAIKDDYPDALLFYRMGDFYEMFFDDAKVASRLLEITLTSRNKNDDGAIPMCGVPVRAADTYISRLIKQGKKVAVCEQVEDPKEAKGLVKREVVRVVTPGMVLDEAYLDEKANNYILALSINKKHAGLSYLDISTGAFRLTESDDIRSIFDEAVRVSPSEIILVDSAQGNPKYASILKAFSDKPLSYVESREFEFENARERLLNQFSTRSLEGFGCEDLSQGVSAAGALLSYVQDSQLQSVSHLTSIETYYLGNHLIIDDLSCKNLELIGNIQTSQKKGSLFGILDKTVTSMGGRLLNTWIRYPLMDKEKIISRQDAIQEGIVHPHVKDDIRASLKNVYDLERLGSRISMGRCNARDMVALKNSLYALPEMFSLLKDFSAPLFSPDFPLEDLTAVADLIEASIREDAPPTINEGGIIKKGFNAELDELISISRDGKSWIAKIGAQEKEKTGIQTLKVKYNKVFGYFIEMPKSQSGQVPDYYIRKQTLVNTERFITEELKEFETKVLGAQEQRSKLEYEIFDQLRKEIILKTDRILHCAKFIAQVDCILSLSEVAIQNDYTRPEINEEGKILIEDGRHPVVEKLITGERYVPNSILMDNAENQLLIITGPNMAGKSTILRQVAIFSVLTQIGAFVPAAKASLCLTDRIFTRVGALDNLSSGQSTFMVEMEETANILNNATPNSLVIMDEIGRGTSTYDGLSIAWAVAEYLHDIEDRGVKTLFATHYHELTELSTTKTRVKNYNIAVKEQDDHIIFLRKLTYGATNRSYGIQVARLAGIPEPVIKQAKCILTSIEKDNKPLSIQMDKTDEPQEVYEAEPLKEEKKPKQIQLSLFKKQEEIIIDQIKKIDISTTTPLDALNFLSKLKEKANKISTENL